MLSLLSVRKECSLKEEVEKRQRSKAYFSSKELRSIIEYAFEQLNRLSLEKIHHLNIKPSNMLKNLRGDFSLAECGYPSLNKSLDNDVFRSPQFLEFLAKKKSLSTLTAFDKEAADIFSLGLCFVQAATLESTKDLKVFNDEHSFPQDAKDILEKVR